MVKYNEKPAEEQEEHWKNVQFEVLMLFGQAERLKGHYTGRQVPRRPTLEELDNPQKRWEDDR